jgi:hypothetical protein
MNKELTRQHQHHQQKFVDIKCLALLTITTSIATSSDKMNSILYDLFNDLSRMLQMIFAMFCVRFSHLFNANNARWGLACSYL